MLIGFAYGCLVLGALASPPKPPPIFKTGERILFQGDSITDGNRGRNEDPNHILGHGYVFIIAAKYGAAYPERNLVFVNRGTSGDTVRALARRWPTDTLSNKPDVLSVMIGINDVLLSFNSGRAVSVPSYTETYDHILADARADNPKVRLILCEPFFAPGDHTHARLSDWKSTLAEMQLAVDKLGAKYHAPVVKLQQIFDRAAPGPSPAYWIWDGIHPTSSGHQLIADEWLKTYQKFYGTSK